MLNDGEKWDDNVFKYCVTSGFKVRVVDTKAAADVALDILGEEWDYIPLNQNLSLYPWIEMALG